MPQEKGQTWELAPCREKNLAQARTVLVGLVPQPLPSQVSFTPTEEPKPPPESPAPPSRPVPPQSLEGLQLVGSELGILERAPIQNHPWKESSLDQPYEKPRKCSEPSSESR